MNLKYQDKIPKLVETDRLLLSELNKTIKNATEAFEEYNYSKAKLEMDQFFWQTLADNYLEIVKSRVYNGSEQEKASAHYTLYQALLAVLKMVSPITPFITEEIYQTHFKKHENAISIHNENWPSEIKIKNSKSDSETWKKMIEVVSLVRQEKSKAQKSMKAESIITMPKEYHSILSDVLSDLKAVTSAKEIKTGNLSVQIT